MATSPWKKDPDDIVDYAFDFGARWMDEGDAIASATITVVPEEGITIGDDDNGRPAPDWSNGTHVVFWVLGGSTAGRYLITCRVTTDENRLVDKTHVLTVE